MHQAFRNDFMIVGFSSLKQDVCWSVLLVDVNLTKTWRTMTHENVCVFYKYVQTSSMHVSSHL